MRYEKGHKATTRKRILVAASRRVRKYGVEGTALADVMAQAGLTHGGFYAHFRSKEELLRAAVTEALDRSYERLHRKALKGGFEAMVREYLANWQVAQPEQGCAFAALMPEIARSSLRTRTVVVAKLEVFAELFARYLPGESLHARRRRAIAILGMLTGTLQLARAAPTRRQTNQMLSDGIRAAIILAKAP